MELPDGKNREINAAPISNALTCTTVNTPRSNSNLKTASINPGTNSSGVDENTLIKTIPCMVKLCRMTKAKISCYTTPTPMDISDVSDPPGSLPEFPQFDQGGYQLRERKTVDSASGGRRSNRGMKNVDYVELSSDEDKKPRSRRKLVKTRPGFGPSLDRICAQKHGKTEHPSQVEVSNVGSGSFLLFTFVRGQLPWETTNLVYWSPIILVRLNTESTVSLVVLDHMDNKHVIIIIIIIKCICDRRGNG